MENPERELRKRLVKQLDEIIEKIRDGSTDIPIDEKESLYFIELIKAMKKAPIDVENESVYCLVGGFFEDEEIPDGLYFILAIRDKKGNFYWDKNSELIKFENAEAFEDDDRVSYHLPFISEFFCEEPCNLSEEVDDEGYSDLVSVFDEGEKFEEDNQDTVEYTYYYMLYRYNIE